MSNHHHTDLLAVQRWSRAQIAAHISSQHPEQIYPTGSELARWTVDELRTKHDELHQENSAECPWCKETFFAPPLCDPLRKHWDYCPQRPADEDEINGQDEDPQTDTPGDNPPNRKVRTISTGRKAD